MAESKIGYNLVSKVNQLFDSSGNRLYSGKLWIGREEVSMPANQLSVSITASSKNGYNFLFWLQPVTVGFAGSVYLEDPRLVSTKAWLVGTARSSTSTIVGYPVYEKV